jgi:hypothetical protein
MNKFIILNAQMTAIILFSMIVLTLLPLTKVFAESTVTSVETAPSGIDWNTLCTDLSQMNILLQNCSHLLNSNGTLTPAGDRAIWCVKNILGSVGPA